LALASRPFIHPVTECTVAPSPRRDGPDLHARIARNHIGKDLEAGAAKDVGDICHPDRIAQVGLVRAKLLQGVRIWDERKFRGHRLAAGELLEHSAHHRFDRVEDILLRDEAHLQVELVEFPRRAVGARVLIAKAWRDLKIAVEAGHHHQLLELLRRLRQRIELAGMKPRGHQKVARALGGGRGQDGGLELEEPLLLHAPPDRIDDGSPHHDVAVEALAAQIEEAIFQAKVFGRLLFAEHLDGQLAGRSQHLDLADIDLDRAGRQLGIVRPRGTLAHLAVDAHDPFRVELLRLLECSGVRIGHQLRDAVMVAQVDEEEPAVIANAMAPAGQAHVLSDVGFPQVAAGVGAITVHQRVLVTGAEGHMRSAGCQEWCRSGLDSVPPICTLKRAFHSPDESVSGNPGYEANLPPKSHGFSEREQAGFCRRPDDDGRGRCRDAHRTRRHNGLRPSRRTQRSFV
jgi:hypothetical protein